jgi:hypothetical protein
MAAFPEKALQREKWLGDAATTNQHAGSADQAGAKQHEAAGLRRNGGHAGSAERGDGAEPGHGLGGQAEGDRRVAVASFGEVAGAVEGGGVGGVAGGLAGDVERDAIKRSNVHARQSEAAAGGVGQHGRGEGDGEGIEAEGRAIDSRAGLDLLARGELDGGRIENIGSADVDGSGDRGGMGERSGDDKCGSKGENLCEVFHVPPEFCRWERIRSRARDSTVTGSASK